MYWSWSHDLDLLLRPLVPATILPRGFLVSLLLALAPIVLLGANKITSAFVCRDVAICLLEKALRGSGRSFRYVFDEYLIV